MRQQKNYKRLKSECIWKVESKGFVGWTDVVVRRKQAATAGLLRKHRRGSIHARGPREKWEALEPGDMTGREPAWLKTMRRHWTWQLQRLHSLGAETPVTAAQNVELTIKLKTLWMLNHCHIERFYNYTRTTGSYWNTSAPKKPCIELCKLYVK